MEKTQVRQVRKMARPVKCRRVCALPQFQEFGPGEGACTGQVEMGVDEYEAVRLIDHLGLSQEEAAAGMGVSRATVQGIYDSARKKLAAALVEGKRLRVDGGASVSDILMQLQADLLRIPVDRPRMVETTAFGAAALAGLSCGVWSDLEELTRLRRSQRVFEPLRPQADCDRDYRLWKRAVSRASDWIEH